MEQLVEAMNRKDAAAAVACMSPDVELRSPITRRIAFRGRAQIQEVLEVVYAEIEDSRITEVVGDGDVRVLLGSATVRGLPIEETMVLRLGPDGLVRELKLFVRAMPQLVTFAAAIGPPLARRRSRLRGALLAALFTPLAFLLRSGEPLAIKLSGAGTPIDPTT